MGTLNAIYVRATAEQIAILRPAYPGAYTEPGLEFYTVEQPPTAFVPPEAELIGWSAHLGTDVFWLTFQSTADAFRFHHWRSGKSLRALIYGCDEQGMWERVEGTPEPWERAAFFAPEELAREYAGDATAAAERERIWRDAEIAVGRTVPSIDARESARAVAEFYRLPGWS